jgi:hypothetical protein
MSENVVPLFPTPVGAYEIDVDLDFVYKKITEYTSAPHFLLEDSDSSFGQDSNILQDPDLADLRLKLLECIKDYTDTTCLQELEITGAWYNQMRKGNKVTLHRHEGSVISGAFYVKTDENTVPLRFQTPLKPYKMNDLYENFNSQYASSGVQINPQPGSLLLFPSWLEHETDAEKGERCVISFNTLYKAMFVNPDT